MRNDYIAQQLVKTGAFTDLEHPVILASGQLGIYYINTEKLFEDKGQWKVYGDNDPAMVQHATAMMVRNPSFEKVIENIAGEVGQLADLLPQIKNIVISGGQRRDWLFSGPVAAQLGLPHISLYKDGRVNIIEPNGKIRKDHSLEGIYAVHLVDLITEGSSILSLDETEGWVPTLRKHGATIHDLYSIVSRRQNGEERLARVGVVCQTFSTINEGFLKQYSSNPDRAVEYHRDPDQWSRQYLREHGALAVVDTFNPYGKNLPRARKFIDRYESLLEEIDRIEELDETIYKNWGMHLERALSSDFS